MERESVEAWRVRLAAGQMTLADALEAAEQIEWAVKNEDYGVAEELRACLSQVLRRLAAFPEMLAARVANMGSITAGQRLLFLEIVAEAREAFGVPGEAPVPTPDDKPVPRQSPAPPSDVME